MIIKILVSLYRIDFADVNNLSEFFKDNAVAELYSVSSEYALFIRTNMDLSDSANLPASGFTFDANLKIDVTGTDISVLDSLSGQLVLAEEMPLLKVTLFKAMKMTVIYIVL